MDIHAYQKEIRDFYNKTPEIWASNDYWHLWSKKQIETYLRSVTIHDSDYVLNAGSGETTTG